MLSCTVAAATFATTPPTTPPQSSSSGLWLDRPLANWNVPGAAIPPAESPRDLEGVRRCQLTEPSTPAAQALAAEGWIPFHHLDRELVQDEVNVLGGLLRTSDDCGPLVFNLFVFVRGRFAGTVSPVAMNQQTDGVAGPVRLLPDGSLSAEFARYGATDTPCCPSGRLTVRYRIEDGAMPVLVPVEVRTTR